MASGGMKKIEKAVERPSGIFNLHNAMPADPAFPHNGIIIYVDEHHVYQQTVKQIVLHDVLSFDRIPKVGASMKFTYLGGRVITGTIESKKHSRSNRTAK